MNSALQHPKYHLFQMQSSLLTWAWSVWGEDIFSLVNDIEIKQGLIWIQIDTYGSIYHYVYSSGLGTVLPWSVYWEGLGATMPY